MQNNTIHILDNNTCKCSKDLEPKIKKILEYPTTYWVPKKTESGVTIKRKGKIVRERKNGIASFCRYRKFSRGFLSKVLNNLKPLPTLSDDSEWVKNQFDPRLPGIKFYLEQERLILKGANDQRGVLKAPTGYGKTIIIGGLISCFKGRKILFLCHTIDLLNQAVRSFNEWGLGPICKLGDGRKNIDLNCDIVTSTIQTFSKFDQEELSTKFDLIIVDECHHVTSDTLYSMYYKVLSTNLAPIKIGLTATLHEDLKRQLQTEELLGPVIDEITLKEGEKKGKIIAPTVKLIPFKQICDCYKWREVYEECIVNSAERVNLIKKEFELLQKENKTCLIMVREKDHGLNIQKFINIPFLSGDTKSDERTEYLKKLNKKEIPGIICTKIFDEGVNIPTLDCVILADSNKSLLNVMQKIGRGTRVSKGKDLLLIVDFVAEQRYLADHFAKRLNFYIANNWKIIY